MSKLIGLKPNFFDFFFWFPKLPLNFSIFYFFSALTRAVSLTFSSSLFFSSREFSSYYVLLLPHIAESTASGTLTEQQRRQRCCAGVRWFTASEELKSSELSGFFTFHFSLPQFLLFILVWFSRSHLLFLFLFSCLCVLAFLLYSVCCFDGIDGVVR